MIRVELLPASFGDCILIEYGTAAKTHRVLIDAGLTNTYKNALGPRLQQIVKKTGAPVRLDLLVVTHIDKDHIRGILPLLEEDPPVVVADDIWFNGRKHLSDDLGAKEGEALGELLEAEGLPWNKKFKGGAVVVPEEGKLPTKKLAGGAVITLLSPYRDELHALDDVWDDTLGSWDEEEPAAPGAPEIDDVLGKRAPLASIDINSVRDLADAKFSEDDTKPNGSSIAFLFEYGKKRILFGADAYPSRLLQSLERYSKVKVKLHALKVSHHGSQNNLSTDLLDKLDCARFLVSSDGGTYGHPDPEALARIVAASTKVKTLCFNYSTDYTTVWDDHTTRTAFGYEVEYPADPKAGYVLRL